MTNLLQNLENVIQERRLIKSGAKVLVAVSGGMDSMVLLHLLATLSRRRKWRLVVAHFNHQLRGRASDLDERLVCQTAAKMKLPVVVERADVKGFAARAKLSIEMAARKLRHEFFARAARKHGAKTIVLAHHADDQVELFFLRLLRGSGSEGLGGMKWKSPSPVDRTIGLVRPLLGSTKADLQSFAAENKVRFREDASNASSDFLRNRIRNELLPLLRKDYQPALSKTVLRLMEIVGAESEFVGDVARYVAVKFEQLPLAAQRRFLQMRLMEAGIGADFDLIESLRQFPDRFVSVGSAISVARDVLGKIKLREEGENKFRADELRIELRGRAGQVRFNGSRFEWRIRKVRSGVGFRRPSSARSKREVFDADRVGGEITLRHWRAGDQFQPIGLKSSVKLQDLFVNAKIPRNRRHELIVAAGESGEIFWVEGLRISENFKVTRETRREMVWIGKRQL
ncbi:MAG TPA: tRNA lysidine(34) synthetase TilS [Verrucomicrobiae bacterium]